MKTTDFKQCLWKTKWWKTLKNKVVERPRSSFVGNEALGRDAIPETNARESKPLARHRVDLCEAGAAAGG